MNDDNQEFVRSLERVTLKLIAETVENMKTACMVIEEDARKNCDVDKERVSAAMFSGVCFDAHLITGVIGNTYDEAPNIEKGTGIYAKYGNGRKLPCNSANKNLSKWLDKRGQQDSGAHSFLEQARDSNKSKIVEILTGKRK